MWWFLTRTFNWNYIWCPVVWFLSYWSWAVRCVNHTVIKRVIWGTAGVYIISCQSTGYDFLITTNNIWYMNRNITDFIFLYCKSNQYWSHQYMYMSSDICHHNSIFLDDIHIFTWLQLGRIATEPNSHFYLESRSTK